MYSVRPNPKGCGYDVIRMVPHVVSSELSKHEAEALAAALNTNVRQLEEPK